MHLLFHKNKQLSDLLALSALLLFISLEVIGCKDMEDCRSLYNNNLVWIEFKGHDPLKIYHAEIMTSSNVKKRLEDTFFHADDKKTILEDLKNLKGKRLPLQLPLQDTSVTLLLYTTPAHNQSKTITLHYHVKHSLLSPNCGMQAIYVIDRVETFFQSGIILAPEGKVANYIETQKPHVEISY